MGIAKCCLGNGAAHVVSIDIGETDEDFSAVAKDYPSRLHAIHADVTSEESATQAVDRIIADYGGLHGMVVNAGRTKHKAALDFTTEEINQLFSINLFGAFYCARVAARAFIRQGVKGSIVFTASMASYRPNKRVPSTPYGASKAGVRNMTHTLAMEWAQHNIRVNSVSPGLVNTAMTYWVPQQSDWEQQLKYYGGMPRLAEVEELGGAYVYLLSDAASYTTSIDIPVNGVIGSEYSLHYTLLLSPRVMLIKVLQSARGYVSRNERNCGLTIDSTSAFSLCSLKLQYRDNPELFEMSNIVLHNFSHFSESLLFISVNNIVAQSAESIPLA